MVWKSQRNRLDSHMCVFEYVCVCVSLWNVERALASDVHIGACLFSFFSYVQYATASLRRRNCQLCDTHKCFPSPKNTPLSGLMSIYETYKIYNIFQIFIYAI